MGRRRIADRRHLPGTVRRTRFPDFPLRQVEPRRHHAVGHARRRRLRAVLLADQSRVGCHPRAVVPRHFDRLGGDYRWSDRMGRLPRSCRNGRS